MPGSLQTPKSELTSVLVTGASSGIGRALAEAFYQRGLKVFGTTRSPNRDGLMQGIQWIEFEGASSDGLTRFMEANKELLTTIDILVNNSGSSYFGKASDIPEASKKRQHHLLYETPVKLTEAVTPHMKARHKGAIINVSSLAAIFPIPYLEDYSNSKAQLSAYTRSIIRSTEGTGVIVIDFQPGDYRTHFNSNLTRYGALDSESSKVWRQLERNLQSGPDPDRAARDVLSSLRAGKSGTVCSGSFFQSKIAPLASRLLPRPAVNWAIRKYYRI